MRAAIIALMLMIGSPAGAWFDIFAQEKYLHCVFKDGARYSRASQTFSLKGNKITSCSVQERYGSDMLREQKVTEIFIYVKCQIANSVGRDYVDEYYIDRITGKVKLSAYDIKAGTIFFKGICDLRDSKI